jgi:CRP-like cAMP-binding protein
MQNAHAVTARTATPRLNRLLAALPAAEFRRLEAEFESITLSPGQVLYEAGDVMEFVYFPTAGIVSLIWPTEDGTSNELAMVGSDGLIGLPAVLGTHEASYCVLVQSAGHAWRIRSAVLRWIIGQGGELLHRVTQYAQALVSQIAQLALCHRHHKVEQQLCRWLLQCLDRLPDNQLQATQHAVASRLGVRRADVSSAASKLLAAGLITYVRGQITILDRRGIEARACGCYATLKKDVDHLL